MKHKLFKNKSMICLSQEEEVFIKNIKIISIIAKGYQLMLLLDRLEEELFQIVIQLIIHF